MFGFEGLVTLEIDCVLGEEKALSVDELAGLAQIDAFIENDVEVVIEVVRFDSFAADALVGDGFAAFQVEAGEAVVFAGADGDELAAHRGWGGIEAGHEAFVYSITSSFKDRVR